ncbi:twin-arginine translocase subunit TatB [Rhizobium sp. rho-13.1]|uniref:Sec-independent protein translocase protein TatB n=1 Tax=Rhizobium rhododendri TaxID=2506430 RepID=A0ABY8IL63_9HYPH|nr:MULTISPECIES: Sec-independent protein translocase protein TatB [Rhizobium]MBZ5758335.1 Sec-independent protein translocase protein TatB [Rhizobium sp. VS19-DR96]MBZ5764835.1 Sec-independent protein translocase protein TatB [Rhizobium sp. VS19-DR129.2]MBZ5772378.1 Sec-independent protein translocase protein TatB [Rhizobium sp. VS19-DRK62.2]MBZ5782935.1 Sec-independent protein translocase protein TatB [Rhizobium sp. VS19-DR121]MBZ5800383.1 Sec-independent protein translocase protein TatB [Rhi
MFDIGWSELLVIAVVLIVVVGPKDLPPMLRTFGKMMTRFRKVAGDFRAQFDDALREADLDDVRQTIADAQKLNPAHSLREAMNPLRQMGNDIKADLQRSTTVERPAEPQMLPHTDGVASEPTAPVVAEAPAPVVAPAPAAIAEAAAVVAETAVKPKAVRKPRAKPELIATEVPTLETTVEAITAPKAARKPRVRAEALDVQASAPVVTSVPVVKEVLSPSTPVRRPRVKAQAADLEGPSVVEPAQVGLPAADKPKRARKPVAPKPAVDNAVPQQAAGTSNTPVTKEDDA